MIAPPLEIEPMHRELVRRLTAAQVAIWNSSPYSARNQRLFLGHDGGLLPEFSFAERRAS